MNKHRTLCSFVVGSLLLAAPGILAAREPKLHNPCKDLRNDLDSQVNNLHKRQDDELAQCRQANGKNADVCSELKTQQQLALRQLRDQRQTELSRCNPRLNGSSAQSGRSDSCYNAAYEDNDRYHHKKHPDHPYPPTTNPPNAHNPPKNNGSGNGHRGDPDAGPTRNAGSSGSQHGSDHSSGSSSSGSGGGSGSSSHSGTSSGSGASSGSGSSGSSSSSNSSSSGSSPSSNTSNNSSSGSSYSPPASSAPAPSSAPSHSSGGGRPPR